MLLNVWIHTWSQLSVHCIPSIGQHRCTNHNTNRPLLHSVYWAADQSECVYWKQFPVASWVFHTFGWSSCCVPMTKCRRVPGFFHVAFQDPIDQHQSSVISFQNETTARKQRKRNEGMPRLFLSNSGKLILLLAWFDWIIVFQIESLLNSVRFGECTFSAQFG